MFEDLRLNQQLSRVELAARTGRSVGYILKAEQATFPTPPVALMNYWVQEGQTREVLEAAYYDTQRRRRESWLDNWQPLMGVEASLWLPFRRKWVKRPGAGAVGSLSSDVGLEGFNEPVFNPTAYGISVGLCLPAAVIYRNDKDLTKAGAISSAMGDLCEFVLSGRLVGETYFTQRADEEESIMRIAKEEGWTQQAQQLPKPNSLAS